MSIIIEEISRLPETDTVFNLNFAMDVGEAPEGHRLTITCLWPPIETQLVRLYSARPTPITLRFKSGYELRGEMDVRRSGGRHASSIGVYANLSYDWRGQPPIQHFHGFIFLREVEPDPPPPVPPMPPWDPDEPVDDDTPIVTPRLDALFPYVYVRQWPKIPDEDLEYGFYAYVAASPPSSSFIGDLGKAYAQGRAAMEALAIDYHRRRPALCRSVHPLPPRSGRTGRRFRPDRAAAATHRAVARGLDRADARRRRRPASSPRRDR